MEKELLLYGDIASESTSQFMTDMNDAKDVDITVRVNCIGGNPEYGWGMVAKFKEHTGNKNIKVDGKAYSMGAYFLCYADFVEGLDVSKYLLHRAAYPSWIEESPNFATGLKTNLDSINADLKKALENKIDVAALEAIMDTKPETLGKKFKDIFSMDGRLDVFLNATEAKKIGLINKINKITPAKKAEIDSTMFDIAAKHIGVEKKPSKEENPDLNSKKNNVMKLSELKADHPELFAEVVALGVAQEKDRVEAAMVFVDLDPAGVKAAIESGKPLSQKQMADFAMKQMSKNALATIEGESAKEVKTDEAAAKEKTKEEKELEEFEKNVDAGLGLKKEEKK
jgi:ATP-dependent protease ClpP protease subunit